MYYKRVTCITIYAHTYMHTYSIYDDNCNCSTPNKSWANTQIRNESAHLYNRHTCSDVLLHVVQIIVLGRCTMVRLSAFTISRQCVSFIHRRMWKWRFFYNNILSIHSSTFYKKSQTHFYQYSTTISSLCLPMANGKRYPQCSILILSSFARTT